VGRKTLTQSIDDTWVGLCRQDVLTKQWIGGLTVCWRGLLIGCFVRSFIDELTDSLCAHSRLLNHISAVCRNEDLRKEHIEPLQEIITH